jgi:probable HAF family extracellular repeat protein
MKPTIAAALGVAIVLPALCSAANYTVTDLGDLPGGDNNSKAYAINNHGQVVGEGIAGFSNGVHAFLWDQTNGMQDIGSLPGIPPGSIAYGINDNGQVTGALTASVHAFRWDIVGGAQDLGSGIAYAINNSGQAVGISGSHAALWNSPSGFLDLGVLSGAVFSVANAISNNGEVVGGDNVPNAFLWTSGSGMQDLKTLNGNFIPGAGLVANDINDHGQVVGQQDLGANNLHAFLWTNAAGVLDLGVLPDGSTISQSLAVNNNGQVVGTSGGNNLGHPIHAFVWNSVTGMQDLNGLLDQSGVGWELEYANDINDYGQIVGSGWGPNGYHAFLLTPTPEPSSVVLAGLGLLGLVAWGWRRRLRSLR